MARPNGIRNQTQTGSTSAEARTYVSRSVERVVRGLPTSDGAGVKLTRLLGTPELPRLDPFLMLDEFKNDDPKNYEAGFPTHPHRGFETFSYMIAGRFRHEDNHGGKGLLEAGGGQWMTAGRGVLHSEMPEQADGLVWGFQLWLNLPAREKMRAPEYHDVHAHLIPTVPLASGQARLVAGRIGEVRGPVGDRSTEPVFMELLLKGDGTSVVPIPAGHNAFVYPFDGDVVIGDEGRTKTVRRGELAVLRRASLRPELRIASASGDARALVIAGKPIGEPVVQYGPFVMNDVAGIERAILDFQAGKF